MSFVGIIIALKIIKDLYIWKFKDLPQISKVYVIINFFMAVSFTWPGWYGFITSKISVKEAAVFFALTSASQIVLEVPTGVFADKFGRKLSTAIAICLYALGNTILYFVEGFSFFVVIALVWGLAGAFASGAFSSLLYDSKGIDDETFAETEKITGIFWQISLIFTTVIGGYMFKIGVWLPFLAEIGIYLISLPLLLKYFEEVSLAKSRKKVKLDMFKGFKVLRDNNGFRQLAIYSAVILSCMWMGIDILNESIMIEFGLEEFQRGQILSGAKIASLILINVIVLNYIKTDRQILIYTFTITVSYMVLLSIGNIYSFLIGTILFNTKSGVSRLLLEPKLQSLIESKQRATVMSTFGFISGLVIIFLYISVGFLQEVYDSNHVYLYLLMLVFLVNFPILLVRLFKK